MTTSYRNEQDRVSPQQGGTSALNAVSTRDIDEQAALLRGWNQSYEQISTGPFSGSLMEVDLHGALLFREITSNALHQTGALPSDTLAVGLPLTLRGTATFCGRPCNGSELHVFSGNDSFEFHSPCGLDIAGFVLAKDDLRRTLTPAEHAAALANLESPHLRRITQDAAIGLRRLFADICEIALDPSGLADPMRNAAITRDLTLALMAALAGTDERTGFEIPSARRARIVRDARDLVHERPEHYQRVEELCATLGVSRRALQHCFQETLGMKPTAFLRAIRMNGARRAMRTSASVAEAATLWGFWHFGRFSADYRIMFGELPSETFRRHRA